MDWPHAWIGAAHCDAVTLRSGAGLSGIDPQPLVERQPLTRHVDPALIDVPPARHAGSCSAWPRGRVAAWPRGLVAASAGPHADRRLVDMMAALSNASLRRRDFQR